MERIFVSVIFALEDCIYYHDMTSADTTHWTIPSSANASYNSDGMKLQGSSWTDCYLEVPLTKPSSIEFDLTDYTGNNPYSIYLFDSTKANRRINMYRTDGGWTALDTYPNSTNAIQWSIPKGSHVKLNVNNSNLELYVDDVLKISKSYSMDNQFIFGMATNSNRSTTYKNIKIKPL